MVELRQHLPSPQGDQHHGELNDLWWREGLVFPAGGLEVQDQEELEVLRASPGLGLFPLAAAGPVQNAISDQAQLLGQGYGFTHRENFVISLLTLHSILIFRIPLNSETSNMSKVCKVYTIVLRTLITEMHTRSTIFIPSLWIVFKLISIYCEVKYIEYIRYNRYFFLLLVLQSII